MLIRRHTGDCFTILAIGGTLPIVTYAAVGPVIGDTLQVCLGLLWTYALYIILPITLIRSG